MKMGLVGHASKIVLYPATHSFATNLQIPTPTKQSTHGWIGALVDGHQRGTMPRNDNKSILYCKTINT